MTSLFQSQAYDSSQCEPTLAEQTIFRQYWRDPSFHSATVKHRLVSLVPGQTVAEAQLQALLIVPGYQPLEEMRVAHFCPYEEDVGLRLAVEALSGLGAASDDKYTQVYLEVSCPLI